MANCNVCGKPVITAKAIHSACWERKANEMAEDFCNNYCRWPRERADEGALREHCDDCMLIRLLNLGL